MKPTPLTAAVDNVYEPSEDSFFLLDCLEKEEGFLRQYAAPTVVELGTGTGVVSAFIPQLITSAYTPIATDVSLAACECAQETWRRNWPHAVLETTRGDLLSFIRPHTVDILIFNPPYVPTESVPLRPDSKDDDRWVDLALDGGKDGMEVTNKVLDNLDTYLSAQGAAYILFIAGNHPHEISQSMQTRGWLAHCVDTRRAGREVLSVYRFTRAE